MSDHDISNLREGGVPEDQKLQNLIKAVQIVMARRGNLNELDRGKMNKWGISDGQLFEISAHIGLGITMSTIANVTRMQLDKDFDKSPA